MVLKPLLMYETQSMGRKQSEEITLPDLYKAQTSSFYKPGVSKVGKYTRTVSI